MNGRTEIAKGRTEIAGCGVRRDAVARAERGPLAALARYALVALACLGLTGALALPVAAQDPSEDATLSALVVNDGSADLPLEPTFNPRWASRIDEYYVDVSHDVETVTVTATPNHAAATVEYGPSNEVPLEVGYQTITIDVTSEDESEDETYKVGVFRAPPATPSCTLNPVDIWCSLLPVSLSDAGLLGASIGDLSDFDFTYKDRTYRFRLIRLNRDELTVVFYPLNAFVAGAAQIALNDLLLQVGSASFRFSEGKSFPNWFYRWKNSGLQWSSGITVTVRVRDNVPIVTSVVVASAPQSGDTYRLYETILFTVTFNEPVRVTPGRLRLEVGLDNPGGGSGSTVEAVFSGLSQSQRPTADTPQAQVARHLHFEYKVQLFDRDADGVRIGANALRLASEARIQSESGRDARLDHAAVGPLSDHKVDGSADVPMIERIEVVSTPRLRSQGTTSRDTYGEGENIRIEVRFDQPVYVEGEPTLALEVGDPFGSVCEAYYESGSGTDALVFAYLVLEVDVDRNGIAIPANPIEVVSGESIRNAADQEAHLSYRRKGTQRGHKVAGSRAAGSHLSVADAEAHEADGKMEFTVRLEPHGLGIVRVDYATRDGSARAGSDYTETSGRLRFNSLEIERTVSVPIIDDAHEDDGETFTLRLSNPDGAKIRGDDDEATGTIHNSEALTASFEDMPETHDRETAFTFRVAFSEDIGISFQALREDAFTVSGGRVTGGKRVDGRRDLFEMTVEPDGGGDVTITLEADRDCAESGAICTKGEYRRKLTNAPSATVRGPAEAAQEPQQQEQEQPDQAAAAAEQEEEEQPQEPPPAPRNLTGVANGDGSVTLSWDAPGDDSVTGYRILRRHTVKQAPGVFSTLAANTGTTATTYTDRVASPETRYAYRVKAINAAGAGKRSNYVKVTTKRAAAASKPAVADGPPGLAPNAPNPFNASTLIPYRLDVDGPVRLEIYNLLGQSMRTLVDEVQAAGAYQVHWDARDRRGALVSAGMYLVRLHYPGGVQTQRLLYLK